MAVQINIHGGARFDIHAGSTGWGQAAPASAAAGLLDRLSIVKARRRSARIRKALATFGWVATSMTLAVVVFGSLVAMR